MSDLDSLKDLFASEESSGNKTSNGKNNYYRFWNMDVDEKAVIRFVVDADVNNPRKFLAKKITHITYNADGDKRTHVCPKTFDDKAACPLCERSAQFYKDEGDGSSNGKQLYRKTQHLAQALIVEDPLKYKEDEEPATGKLKLFNFGFQIYSKITEAFKDDELDAAPYLADQGTDFIIKKTTQGKHSSYQNSKFERRPRALTEAELAEVEENMIELKSLIPDPMTYDELKKICDDHVNYVFNGATQGSSQPAVSQSAPVQESDNVNGQFSSQPPVAATQPTTQQDPAPTNSPSTDMDPDALFKEFERRFNQEDE